MAIHLQCAHKRGGNKNESKVIVFTHSFNHRLVSRIVRVLPLSKRRMERQITKVIFKGR